MSVKYYPIDEDLARRAKEMNSFFDYVEGSTTEAYHRAVDEAVQLAEFQKQRVDPIHHEKIDRLVDAYARKLAENINRSNSISSRVPSILIAGGGNFPVRKKEKQNRAADANMEEWRQIQGLLDKIKSTGLGGISADEPDAVAKLKDKLERLEAFQAKMKSVNAYYRKHKTLDGCPDLSAEDIEKLKADMARSWRAQPKPYESYALSNNNASIRQVKARIEELTRQAETVYEGWQFDGGEVKMDRETNRLQVFFDEKPDRDTCAAMRHGGFRWAPSVGAWQRQLTDNALYIAKHLDCIKPVVAEQSTQSQKEVDSEVPQESISGQHLFTAATPGSIAAKYYELLHECYPLPGDEELRDAEIAEIARFIQREGESGVERLLLSVAGLKSMQSENSVVQELAAALAEELSQYSESGREDVHQTKVKHKSNRDMGR